MSRHYIEQALEVGLEFQLPESNARHLQVLRMQPGQRFTLFNGSPMEFEAEILEMGKRHVNARVVAYQAADRESPLSLTLVQALSASERMDYTVQKATELGVTQIRIIQSALCSYRLADDRLEKRMAHWKAVAISAAEQCGRTSIPAIHPPIRFSDFLRQAEASDVRVLLSPVEGRKLTDLPEKAASAIVLIGPEGGFSEEEEGAAIAAGFLPILLGPRIFRTETVAPVISALLQSRYGDL